MWDSVGCGRRVCARERGPRRDHVFSAKESMIETRAVVDSEARGGGRVEALARLSSFRAVFYGCLSARGDELFELTDAVLCSGGPVTSLPELSLAGVHRRGHGAMYDGLTCGRIEFARLRMTLAGVNLPRDAAGRLRLAVDVTSWPRPDAECSPGRSHCHRYCRCNGTRQTIPGWPYSVIAALESGRTSWTHLLDAVRIGPDQDVTEVTAAQIRDLVARLVAAGAWQAGDAPVLLVMDAGYDVVRLSFLLADLPVVLVARIRSDRVMRGPAPPPPPRGGRPPRHGVRVELAVPASWPRVEAERLEVHPRYGRVHVRAWGGLHPELERRAAWADHAGPLPIIEGSIINITVDHLPGERAAKPMWLWCSDPEAAHADLDWWWRSYLRRFDIEHTFRFLKQTLGLTRPRLRTPEQADRWVWLLIAAYAQLRLARELADDLRHPWERPLPAGRLTPARVRRGFPRIRRAAGVPTQAPKPSRPGPGRPRGATSSPAPRHPVGKKHPKKDTPRRGSKQPTG